MGSTANKDQRVYIHMKHPTIGEPEIFEEWRQNFPQFNDLSQVVLRQPLLQALEYNTLYTKRTGKQFFPNSILVTKTKKT